MVVIYGSRTRSHKISERELHCAKCDKKRTIEFTLTKRVFSLFFMPLFPGGTNVTMRCKECRTPWDVPHAPLDSSYVTFALLDVLIVGIGIASIFLIPFCIGPIIALLLLFLANDGYLGHIPDVYKDFPDHDMISTEKDETKDLDKIKTMSFDYEPRHKRKH